MAARDHGVFRDVRQPLRADEEGGRLDELREAPDEAIGLGRDRSVRCKAAERRVETALECARRAEPTGKLLELSHHGPGVFEQRPTLRSQCYRRHKRRAHPCESSHGPVIELTTDPLALRFRGRDKALAGCLQVRQLAAGRCVETDVAQCELGGGGDAISQDGIDRTSLVPNEDTDFEPGQAEWHGDPPRPSGRYLNRPPVVIDVGATGVEPVTDDQARVVEDCRETVSQRGRLGAITEIDHQASQGIARPTTPAQIDRERRRGHDEHGRQEHPRGREVDRSSRHGRCDQREGHGQRGRHCGRPKATASQWAGGPGRSEQRSRCRGCEQGGLEPDPSDWGRDHGQAVTDRDDGTLDRWLDPAGRVGRKEMHEKAQVDAARDGHQRAREPRHTGCELQVRDAPRRWDAQGDDGRPDEGQADCHIEREDRSVRIRAGLPFEPRQRRAARERDPPDDPNTGITHHRRMVSPRGALR